MIKPLRVFMILYAAVGILLGLSFIVIPDQMADVFNVTPLVGFGRYILVLLAAQFLVASFFLIMASRDPIRYILWVKYAIAHAIVDALVVVYAIAGGYAEFGQIGIGLIIHAVFAVLLLVFYPWRAQEAAEASPERYPAP
jgi:hypothetical protein